MKEKEVRKVSWSFGQVEGLKMKMLKT